MLRRLSVRGKILAALAVPVLVLFGAASYIAVGAVGGAREAASVHTLVSVMAAQDDFLDAVQNERLATAQVEFGFNGAEQKLSNARAVTDRALATRDAQYRALHTGLLNRQVVTAIRATLGAGDALRTARTQVDVALETKTIETSAQYSDQAYLDVVDTANTVPEIIAETAESRTLAQYVELYNHASDLVGQTSVETSQGYALLFSVIDVNQPIIAAAKNGVVTAAIGAASLVAQDTDLAKQVDNLAGALDVDIDMPTTTGVYQVLRAEVGTGMPPLSARDSAPQWFQLSTEQMGRYGHVRDTIAKSVVSYAAGLQSTETTRAAVTIGVGLLALVLSVVLGLAIARQIVNPLRRLTDAAANVREELPNLVEQVAEPGRGPDLSLEEIPVESSDEVGQLARAFNDVNATTIQVAREQAALRGSIAEMFVNVARRDQVLLNRQLSFLDDLERTEEDPSSLANLFRLDHLATRMRRNAESLLVLAGIDSGRRVRQPMPTSDVIRTASSEIEMYDRVRLILPIDPLMLGHNALSAAHLLAELLENATRFSEPHTSVEVTTSQGHDGTQVVIRDFGLGMGPEELREASARVTMSGAADVIGAQRLGLFVVGRLAARLGARVSFASTGAGGQGTTVTVTFPQGLFVSDSAVALPQPTDPLSAETQAAAAQLTGGFSPATAPTGAPAAAPGAVPPVGAGSAPLPAALAASVADAYGVEPEVAVPVDLDALTDGTTATGMPRRRTARPDAPAPTGSAAGAAGTLASGSPAEGAGVILPPLVGGVLPDVDLGDGLGDAAWTPPAVDASPTGLALPSRRREPAPVSAPVPLLAEPDGLALEPSAAQPHALPDDTSVDLVAVPDHVVASSMFTGFRTMRDLDQAVATPEPAQGDGPQQDAAAEAVPVVAPVAPEPVEEQAVAAPAAPFEPAAPVAPEPVDAAELAAPLAAVARQPHPAPVVEPTAEVAAAAAEFVLPEVVLPDTLVHGAPDQAVAEQAWQPEQPEAWAPQFEPAEPVLPTRSEVREAPSAVAPEPAVALWSPAPEGAHATPYADLGGYFGGHDPEPVAEVSAGQSQVGVDQLAAAGAEADDDDPFAAHLPPFDELLVNLPTRRDVREAAKRSRGWFRRGYSQKAYTEALATLSRPTPVVPASAIESPESLGLAPAASVPAASVPVASASAVTAPEPAPVTPSPVAPVAPVDAWTPAAAPLPSPAPRTDAWTPAAAPRVEQAPVEQAPSVEQAPVAQGPVEPAPVVPRRSSVYAAPSPTSAGATAAADPAAAPRAFRTGAHASDPVTAQSEWLASAVLYEEMSSLLRTSPDFESGAPLSQAYEPVVDLTTGPTLSRRARREQALTGELRAPTGIERDADALRERLRAFHSGAQRAREDAATTLEPVQADFTPPPLQNVFRAPSDDGSPVGESHR